MMLPLRENDTGAAQGLSLKAGSRRGRSRDPPAALVDPHSPSRGRALPAQGASPHAQTGAAEVSPKVTRAGKRKRVEGPAADEAGQPAAVEAAAPHRGRRQAPAIAPEVGSKRTSPRSGGPAHEPLSKPADVSHMRRPDKGKPPPVPRRSGRSQANEDEAVPATKVSNSKPAADAGADDARDGSAPETKSESDDHAAGQASTRNSRGRSEAQAASAKRKSAAAADGGDETLSDREAAAAEVRMKGRKGKCGQPRATRSKTAPSQSEHDAKQPPPTQRSGGRNQLAEAASGRARPAVAEEAVREAAETSRSPSPSGRPARGYKEAYPARPRPRRSSRGTTAEGSQDLPASMDDSQPQPSADGHVQADQDPVVSGSGDQKQARPAKRQKKAQSGEQEVHDKAPAKDSVPSAPAAEVPKGTGKGRQRKTAAASNDTEEMIVGGEAPAAEADAGPSKRRSRSSSRAPEKCVMIP